MSTEAERAAKRRYYHRNSKRILAQQQEYRRRIRHQPRWRTLLASNTAHWRDRFSQRMGAWGYVGRGGRGLSPEGYRYRWEQGKSVPPWPELLDRSKMRRRVASGDGRRRADARPTARARLDRDARPLARPLRAPRRGAEASPGPARARHATPRRFEAGWLAMDAQRHLWVVYPPLFVAKQWFQTFLATQQGEANRSFFSILEPNLDSLYTETD